MSDKLQMEVYDKMVLGTATTKDILEAEYDWFVIQKKPKCWDHSENICVYRLRNNNKCAVGIFIPKEKYSKGFEGLNVEDLIKEYKLNEFVEYLPLLKELQKLHDNLTYESEFIQQMQTGIVDIAEEWGVVLDV